MPLRVLSKPDHIEQGSALEQNLAFALMGVGLREITADNVAEFYTRLQILDALSGLPAIVSGWCDNITLADAVAAIGFKINGADETAHTWRCRVVKNFYDEKTRKNKTAIRAAQVASVVDASIAQIEQTAREAGLFPRSKISEGVIARDMNSRAAEQIVKEIKDGWDKAR